MASRLSELRRLIKAGADPKRAKASRWFFKTGPGEYGEGDQFYGLTVPAQRKLAKSFRDLSLTDIKPLLESGWHEERLIALILLVDQFKSGDEKKRKDIYQFYLAHTDRINNWDLVDTSARDIVGAYLFDKDTKPLFRLAKSKLIWERRIAMIASAYWIRERQAQVTMDLAEVLLNDKEDLMHKAVGWMLREVGKNVSEGVLRSFLDAHAATMPRTMLRYAIEKFSAEQKRYYMQMKRLAVTRNTTSRLR